MVPTMTKFGIAVSIILAILLVSISCSSSENLADSEDVILPDDMYNYRLEEVLPNERLLLAQSSLDHEWSSIDPVYVVYDQGSLATLDLPDDPKCLAETIYRRPNMLPDGRLGFVKQCTKSREGSPTDTGEFTLVALDMRSGNVEQIMTNPLYDQPPLGDYSWNPEMTRGVASIGSLGGTLYWISPDGPEPMDIVVGEGSQSWAMSDALTDFWDTSLSLEEWPSPGISQNPAWSPEGETIAFFAAPSATGLDGLARANVPYNLYFMSPIKRQPEIVLENLRNPFALRWSPDGQALLLDACVGMVQQCGLWSYSVEEDSLHLIAPGRKFWQARWLNNSQVIASRCLDREELICTDYVLVQYDVAR